VRCVDSSRSGAGHAPQPDMSWGETLLLVNNAGVGATAPLLDAEVEKMDEMIRLSVGALAG
jgi:short-subunit dehydrogenase